MKTAPIFWIRVTVKWRAQAMITAAAVSWYCFGNSVAYDDEYACRSWWHDPSTWFRVKGGLSLYTCGYQIPRSRVLDSRRATNCSGPGRLPRALAADRRALLAETSPWWRCLLAPSNADEAAANSRACGHGVRWRPLDATYSPWKMKGSMLDGVGTRSPIRSSCVQTV
jgi:hypothetical protein